MNPPRYSLFSILPPRLLVSVPLCLCALSAIPRPALAQPAPDPEIERKSFRIADGLEVNLWAADPMLAKPVNMNFDPAGRLWVATSEIYPQIKPGEKADDKVLVLEDADGDGKADKTTVFARGLLIPTGVLPGDGGAYVANSTELLHMRDTDNDGKADASRVVLSGFGTEDTHHIIHTFRWGQDGLFYFHQSVYIHSHVETPYGPRRLAAGGTWTYRPETQRLEIFTRGLINHWGHSWSVYGDSFMTDGAGGDGINYAFPGAAFVSINDQAPRIIRGLNPGSPKYAGNETVTGRHFPDDWQGDIITNDFRANRVVRYKLSEDGSGFSSKLMPDVITTKDKAFRPVDVKMGPDGALYIADWYNPIINHGEVDFRDPRRDKTHGRIWRITVKNRPLVARPKLTGATVEQLLEQLKAPEDYTRRQARLVLREMKKDDVLPALDKWTQALPPDDALTRLQALWTYQTLDVPNAALLQSLIAAQDPGVRAAAARVLGAWSDRPLSPSPKAATDVTSPSNSTAVGEGRGEGPVALKALEPLVTDPHPRVRLEAVRALATTFHPRAAEIALTALDLPVDRFLDYALYLTITELQPAWLPAFQSGQLTFGRNPKHIEFALKAIKNPAAIKPLVDEFRAGKVSADVADLIASLGTPDDLSLLLEAALKSDATPATRVGLLQSLDRAARQRNARPKTDLAGLKSLTTSSDPTVAAAALRLAGATKSAGLKDAVTAAALATDHAVSVRIAAVQSLADLGDTKALAQLGGADRDAAVRIAAVAALANADAATAATLAADRLATDPADTDFAPLLAAFAKKKDGPKLLGDALKAKPPTADNAKLALRAAYALGRSDAALIDPLKAAAKIDAQAKQLSESEMKQLIADVAAKGDPARGEQVFRRADTSCFRCHAIGGAGGQLGPDLTAAGSAPVDYLIDSLLLPNKAVKEGYHSVIVDTADGDQFTGIRVRQTDKELVLRDAVQDEIVITAAAIKGKPRDGQSMMPAGLTDPLTRQELLDLVRFLSELGRPGPYAIANQPVARRWETVAAPADLAAGQPLKLPPAAVWEPAYTQVSGVLPTQGRTLARALVNVTTPGPVTFALTTSPGHAAWINDRPVVVTQGRITADLTPGSHTLTVFAPDSAPLRLELAETTASPAKVQFVTGK
jgi:putative heme-binding domain-containing protein